MAYDEGLAQRIREALEDEPGASEKRMFGGVCFLVHEHMVAGVVGSELMVRVGVAAWQDALDHPHAREMDFTGRALKGFVYVAEEGIAEDDDLHGWLALGVRHVGTLPPRRSGRRPGAAQSSRATAAPTPEPAATRTKRVAKKPASAKTKPAAKKPASAKTKPAAKKPASAKTKPARKKRAASKKKSARKKRAAPKKKSAAKKPAASKKKPAAKKRAPSGKKRAGAGPRSTTRKRSAPRRSR